MQMTWVSWLAHLHIAAGHHHYLLDYTAAVHCCYWTGTVTGHLCCLCL